MKKILISMVAALALLPVFTSCSNDDDNKPEKTAAQSVEANYVGGTYANCKYFQNYQPTENDTVFVKATQTADVATLSYTSATWGEFTFEGTVNDGKLVATFDVPAVMGGTTVLFNPADFKEVFEAAQNKDK